MTYEEAKQIIEALGKTFSCGYVRSKTGRSVQRWIVEYDGEKTYYTKFQFEKLYSEIVRASQKEEDTVKHQVKNSLIVKIHQIAKYSTDTYDYLINLSVLQLKAMIEESEEAPIIQEDEPKDADPILDEEELLLETIKDLDFQITQATKKLQDHHKDKAHYLNRLKVYRQGKTGKSPEQEQAERALIKRFADRLTNTVKSITKLTTARFLFVNTNRDSIENVITMIVPDVINKEDGSLHEGICDLIKTYPEAEISIRLWNQEDV